MRWEDLGKKAPAEYISTQLLRCRDRNLKTVFPTKIPADMANLRLRFLLEAASIFIGVFSASLILFKWYVAGDLCYYRSAYLSVEGLPISSALHTYRQHIFAADLFHFIFIWISSNIGPHDVVMAVVNGGLGVLLYTLLRVNEVGRFLSIALICFNYYFWVVAIPAERLKFAIIFSAIFYLTHNSKLRLISFCLSLLSHASSAVLFLPFFSAVIFKANRFRISLRWLLICVFLALLIVLTIGQDVFDKVLWIAKDVNASFWSVVPTLLLCGLALSFSKRNPLSVSLVFLAIAALILVVSSNRLNMFSLIIALGYLIESKAQLSPVDQGSHKINKQDVLLLIASTFLFMKGLPFISSIYHYGSGFGALENTCI